MYKMHTKKCPLSQATFRGKCVCAVQESEYAAWTLTNGWSLNHTTIAVHHMRKHGFRCDSESACGLLCSTCGDGVRAPMGCVVRRSDIEGLIAALSDQGFHLNEAGGVLKVGRPPTLHATSVVCMQALSLCP